MKLIEKAEKSYNIQDYAKKKMIDGVKVLDLKRFTDDGGSFTEIARLQNSEIEGIPGFIVKQVNFSVIAPEVIKAFHLHKKQSDVWYIPPSDKILLYLADLREDSNTKNIGMRLVLGDGKSQLVLIPPGVAHGCKNISTSAAQIIYFNDYQFSTELAECDEGRLPWNFFGEKIWEIEKG